MITLVLHCPHCDGVDIVRHGKSPEGKQRYRCREKPCNGRTFLLDYSYAGQSLHVKDQIVEMALKWQWHSQCNAAAKLWSMLHEYP